MPVTRMATVAHGGVEFAAFRTAAQAIEVGDRLWALHRAAGLSTIPVSVWDGDVQLLSLDGILSRAGAAACGFL